MNEFPYQAALIHFNRFDGGACVIHEKYLLTAAHNVHEDRDVSHYRVKVGASKLDAAKTFELSEFRLHPLFDSEKITHDLAIIVLKGKFKFSNTIQPIYLAGADVVLRRGQMLNVSGWGLTEYNDISDKFLYLPVPYIDWKTCRNNYYQMVDDSMICAGYVDGTGDSCTGDSGGPIAANNVLYGVVSWGKGCGIADSPGVYASVAFSRKWIHDQIGI